MYVIGNVYTVLGENVLCVPDEYDDCTGCSFADVFECLDKECAKDTMFVEAPVVDAETTSKVTELRHFIGREAYTMLCTAVYTQHGKSFPEVVQEKRPIKSDLLSSAFNWLGPNMYSYWVELHIDWYTYCRDCSAEHTPANYAHLRRFLGQGVFSKFCMNYWVMTGEHLSDTKKVDADTIRHAFSWVKSPEGADFWCKKHVAWRDAYKSPEQVNAPTEDVAPATCTSKDDHAVNRPAHYNHLPTEVIDIIKGVLDEADVDAFDAYCLGNALKYRLRAGVKDPDKIEEDIKKAMWYEARMSSSHTTIV